jgi:hypothetical protein
VDRTHYLDHVVYENDSLAQMWRNEELCDVKVCVGCREWPCHRVILATMGHFRDVFENSTPTSATGGLPTVNVGGMEPDVFECVLRFLYEGTTTVTYETVKQLLKAAAYLFFDDLMEACGRVLVVTTTPINVFDHWGLADEYGRGALMSQLAMACHEVALVFFAMVVGHAGPFTVEAATDFWQHPLFDFNKMVDLLRDDNLDADEFVVIQGLASWHGPAISLDGEYNQAEFQTRKYAEFVDCLQYVRFGNLSLFQFKKVQDLPIMQSPAALKVMLQ